MSAWIKGSVGWREAQEHYRSVRARRIGEWLFLGALGVLCLVGLLVTL